MIDFKEATVQQAMSRAELADYLREVADGIVSADDTCGCGFALGEFHSVSMTVTVTGEDAAVSMRLSQDEEGGEAPQAESGQPDMPYKQLKKRLKSSFKTIFKAIHQQRKPPARSVASFLRDARLMVRFEGKGDEGYAEFLGNLDAFEAAFGQGDTEAMHRACDALNHNKTECHARFK